MSLFQRSPLPLLQPTSSLPWASGAVFNPGAWFDGERVHLLFRAIPEGYRRVETPDASPFEGDFGFDGYVSSVGYATSRDGLHFSVHPEPLLRPDTPADRYGVEDPRISRLGDTYYITYTALRHPAFGDEEGVGIGLASTRDFREIARHGMIGPAVRDKDAVLFPRKIGGRVAMLHRIVPDIQIVYFADEEQLCSPGPGFWDDYLRRLDEHVVMRPEVAWEGKKIGAGPTPVETPEGWLLLYHGADRDHVYRAGLALLDLDDPTRVIARTLDPVMEPETPWEREGDVPNVVFPQGAVVLGETLHVYYGGADRVVGHAHAPLADVVAHVQDEGKKAWRMPPIYMHFRGDRDVPRTWESQAPVVVERLNGGAPLLEPRAEHPWESRVVLNPAGALLEGDALEQVLAAWPVPDADADKLRRIGGACALLYRAQGSAFHRRDRAGHEHYASSLGFALFTPGMEPVYRHPDPAILPDAPFHNLGVEDPRIAQVGNEFYLYYTGYTSSMVQGGELGGRVVLCLATSRNLRDWTFHGPLPGDLNRYPNKNGALVPEKVDGRWLFLHRPMAGPHPMAMHLAEAQRPEGPFHTRGLLAASYRYDDFALSWVGAAGPPVALGGGRFLTLYHQGHLTHERRRMYNLSAMLLDFNRPDPVVSRIEPLLVPTGSREQVGDPQLGVDNVVFSCANYVWQNRLVVPYAGADSRIFAARLDVSALVSALEAAAEAVAV